MEQAYKNLLIVAAMIAVFMVGFAFSDYYCFTHEDQTNNISINECGKKADLEQKYWMYLKKKPEGNNTTIYDYPIMAYQNGNR